MAARFQGTTPDSQYPHPHTGLPSGSATAFKPRNTGQDYSAELEIKHAQMQVLPPMGKRKAYPQLTLTVIHAVERATPTGREPIVWKLLTNLPVNSRLQVIEKLNYYALRWKIEVFHKILKSGCKIEEPKLRTSERLVKLIALYCLIGWRIFWLSMQFRANPEQNPPRRSSPSWNSNYSIS